MPEDQDCATKAEEYYELFKIKNIEVIIDDRIWSIGKKLSDNELIGIPLQLIIGKKNLKAGVVELKNRSKNEIIKIPINKAANHLLSELTK